MVVLPWPWRFKVLCGRLTSGCAADALSYMDGRREPRAP